MRAFNEAKPALVHAGLEPLRQLRAVDLLVIAHPSFSQAIAPLISQRRAQGLRTELLTTSSIYQAQRAAYPDAQSIVGYLRSLSRRGARPRYLLLVGGDSYDYDNVLGLGSLSFVPTGYARTSEFVGHAPTDMPYADLDLDGLPEVAVGRWPVRTRRRSRGDDRQEHGLRERRYRLWSVVDLGPGQRQL